MEQRETERCDSRTSQRSLSPLSIGPVPNPVDVVSNVNAVPAVHVPIPDDSMTICPVPNPLDTVNITTADEDFQQLYNSNLRVSSLEEGAEVEEMISFRWVFTV